MITENAQVDLGQNMDELRHQPWMRRPYLDQRGRPSVSIPTGELKPVTNARGEPVLNAAGHPMTRPVFRQELITNLRAQGYDCPVWNATALRLDEWRTIDAAVTRASREQLVAWDDMRAANSYGSFDGMATTGLVREAMTDAGDAVVDMTGHSKGVDDGVLFTPDVLALPVTHSDFAIDERTLAMSRRSGTPLDTVRAEQSARRVAEKTERMTTGIDDYSGLVIGSSSVYTNRGIYGLTTHPDRITYTSLTDISTWTEGTSAEAVVNNVRSMLKEAYDQNFNGPFVLYYSKAYDTAMTRDYFQLSTSGAVAPSKTVLERIKEFQDVREVKRLPLLSAATTQVLLLVQYDGNIRAVNPMAPTTVQWKSGDGLVTYFKVMAIQVPDIRSQYVGQSITSRKVGIVHGTTA